MLDCCSIDLVEDGETIDTRESGGGLAFGSTWTISLSSIGSGYLYIFVRRHSLAKAEWNTVKAQPEIPWDEGVVAAVRVSSWVMMV